MDKRNKKKEDAQSEIVEEAVLAKRRSSWGRKENVRKKTGQKEVGKEVTWASEKGRALKIKTNQFCQIKKRKKF